MFIDWLLLDWCRWRAMVTCLAALLLGVLLGVSPWATRNILLGVPPLTTAGGVYGGSAMANYNTVEVQWDSCSMVSSPMPRIVHDTGGKILPSMLEAFKTHRDVWSILGMFWNKFDAMWHWWERPDNVSSYFYELYTPVLRWLPVTFAILSPLAIVGMVLGARHFWQHISLYLMAATAMRRCYCISYWHAFASPWRWP